MNLKTLKIIFIVLGVHVFILAVAFMVQGEKPKSKSQKVDDELIMIPDGDKKVTEEKSQKTNEPKEEEDISEEPVKIYLVKKGDSLWKIAHQNKISVSKLAKFNEINAKKPLLVGQTIKIP